MTRSGEALRFETSRRYGTERSAFGGMSGSPRTPNFGAVSMQRVFGGVKEARMDRGTGSRGAPGGVRATREQPSRDGACLKDEFEELFFERSGD
jgi:hypothetical protein